MEGKVRRAAWGPCDSRGQNRELRREWPLTRPLDLYWGLCVPKMGPIFSGFPDVAEAAELGFDLGCPDGLAEP